jgi:DNA-binding winged helix-turn-helix (wHTH) protein/tetratricopeptide (TPR) repeat protein
VDHGIEAAAKRFGLTKRRVAIVDSSAAFRTRPLPNGERNGSPNMKSFRAFRLDTVNHCLWRGEKRVSLPPKAFDVLRYLVEHADRLVTQDEILEKLWPETYVNPEVIKKYVLEIRKVLGDQSSKPAFLATFPRRGYQFIAPVREEIASAAVGPATRATKGIVGRENALSTLADAFSNALQGQRQIVFITGEAGIGKTTLVDVFLQGAFGENARVARGQCVEGFGGKEAYYPILDALGQLCREADDNRMVQELATRAPTWLVQFPSLVNTHQRQALERETIGATRERMVREICETLETIAAQTPLILVLEDLHWVDPSTLDFISALARRRGPAKLLLFGTYRPADVIISRSALKALKQDLVIHNLSHEVSLERLEEVDVAKYICGKFVDGDFPAGFASLIYRRSGGNALFMVTILQDIVKKGLIGQVDGKWKLAAPIETVAQSVPETLDQLIDAQFQQLSAVEQRVLRSASVAGERFSAWAVSTAAEIDPGEIEDVCEGLAAKLQFIKGSGIKEQANGEISAHYEFRHSLYREVLYGRLSEGARSKLHLLLAQRLKSFCDPCEQDLATELALHFEGGRDYEQAVNYLLVAADNAVGRFAYRDCIEILRHAHELVLKLTLRVRAELEVRILELMGHAHFALGALVDSAQTYAAAAARAQQAGLKAAQMHALTCTMYPLGFIGPEEGVAALEEALKISKSVNDPLSLALTQMLAAGFRLVFDSWSETHAELCASAYETLLRLYPSGLDPYQRIVYAHILMLKGKYAEALDLCERSVSEASSSGVGQVVNFLAHFGALSAKIIILLRTGQLGQVLQITRAGRTSPDANLSLYWLLTLREAMLRSSAFDFEGARLICQANGNVREGEFPDAQYYSIDQIAAGNLALQQGKYPEALEHFRRVQDLDVHEKFFMHWQWRMMADLESSNAWLLAGNAVNARTVADGLLKSALATSDPYLHALAWDLQARVATAESDLPGARESIQRALAIVDSSEIQGGGWQTFATASQVYRHAKEMKIAETYRDRAESCILQIANSFEPDEPLRATFLTADPVRRILHGKVATKTTRQHRLGHGAVPGG